MLLGDYADDYADDCGGCSEHGVCANVTCYSDSDCGSGEVCMSPGTTSSWCDTTSGGAGACSSDSDCGSGCYCMSPGTSSSWCDCAGGGGCDCGDGCWSDTCDCASDCPSGGASVCEVCDYECANSCGGYDCIGTDDNVCCYVPECDNGGTGAVIGAPKGNWLARLIKKIFS